MNPCFCSDEYLSLQSLPEEGTQEELSGLLDTVGNPPTLVSKQAALNSSVQSSMAKARYSVLRDWSSSHDDDHWPLSLILLAECHYFMFDMYGAYMYTEKARQVPGKSGQADDTLNQATHYLRVLSEPEPDCWDDEELGVTKYVLPFAYNFDSPLRLSLCAKDFQKLEAMRIEDPDLSEFCRLACVTTNELEGVFAISGESTTNLVTLGFTANSIVDISRTSRIKKKQNIVNILENTMACFPLIMAFVEREQDLTEEYIKKIHETLLEGDNIYSELDDYGGTRELIPTGVYRRSACYANHPNEGNITQFCPAPSLSKDMACAWIQFAFATIHPFGDGNGRVSRILCSIPLLRAGLPPVVVPKERKLAYFEKLDHEGKSGHVGKLAAYFRDEISIAVNHLFDLHTKKTRAPVLATNVARLQVYSSKLKMKGRK